MLSKLQALVMTIVGSVISTPFFYDVFVIDSIVRPGVVETAGFLIGIMFIMLGAVTLLGAEIGSSSPTSNIEANIARIRFIEEVKTFWRKDGKD